MSKESEPASGATEGARRATGGAPEGRRDGRGRWSAKRKMAAVLRLLRQLQRLSKQKHVRGDLFALVYAELGEKEEAISWLEKAYMENERPALIYLTVAPEFDSLRSDLRFQDFLRRAGLA